MIQVLLVFRSQTDSDLWFEGRSQHREVVAGLGALTDADSAVATGDEAMEEASRPLCHRWRPRDGSRATVKPDLSDHALKQLQHIMVQRRRRLNVFTVEYHGTRQPLCRTREELHQQYCPLQDERGITPHLFLKK